MLPSTSSPRRTRFDLWLADLAISVVGSSEVFFCAIFASTSAVTESALARAWNAVASFFSCVTVSSIDLFRPLVLPLVGVFCLVLEFLEAFLDFRAELCFEWDGDERSDEAKGLTRSSGRIDMLFSSSSELGSSSDDSYSKLVRDIFEVRCWIASVGLAFSARARFIALLIISVLVASSIPRL